MAEITLNALAHTYSDAPSKPEDYAIRQMQHVWHQGGRRIAARPALFGVG